MVFERIFPIYSPMIEKIEATKRSRVRRAKLYHIRKKAAKEIRRQMRKYKRGTGGYGRSTPTETPVPEGDL